jgi:hypothetical protein
MAENTTILVCLNSKGRAIQAVGPFETDEEAVTFFGTTASPAYHGFTLVELIAPDRYSAHA